MRVCARACMCCRDCVFDLCAVQSNSTLRCQSYVVYALDCQEQGIVLGPWRAQLECGMSHTLAKAHTLVKHEQI